jgi:GDP/UDP-N,N'-diacetylbacillosamine 2-epimerase (hydrolysing)
MTRKICVVTSSRADYGLLKLVMRGIQEDSGLTLQVIATGAHLSPFHGLTIGEIEADGFEVDRKVECLSKSDSSIAIADATSRALSGCAKALDELKPDLVLVLGDRFEIFAASTAALLARIPIAHIHGGETTAGAYDEAFRHSITKMSSTHFVATEEYGKRTIQLGENPDTVFVVGGLGVDAIKKLKLMTKNEVEKELGFKFDAKSLLVTFHPATLEYQSPREQIGELLAALSERPDTTLIFTMPNADTGGREIMGEIQDFVGRHSNAYGFHSLGQQLYLSCMNIVDGVVGNSSSGILEAPTLKVGTLNIGSRQLGRVQAESVINVAPRKRDIDLALSRLFSPDFKSIVRTCKNPYGDGESSVRILKVLRELSLDGVISKEFYDVPQEFRYGSHHG